MLCTRLPFSSFPRGRASTCSALLLVVSAGCSSSADNKDDRNDSFETDPKVLRAALENPIISCQEARRECRAGAEDAEQRAACNDELATCLQTAADKAQAAASALAECRDEARECVAGDTKLSECRNTYESCTEAAIEGDDTDELDASVVDPDVTDAGSDDDSTGNDDDGDTDAGVSSTEPTPGGNSALPSLPGPRLDGGILAGLPRPEQCIIELRLCIFRDPGSASECGDEARLCFEL